MNTGPNAGHLLRLRKGQRVEVKIFNLDNSSWRSEVNGLETCLVGITGMGCHGHRGGWGGVEARDVAKPPKTKNDPAPNVHSAKG